MNYLSIEEVIILHDDMIECIDGIKGYDKEQMCFFESALEHIKNDEYYLQFLDKLTHMIFTCVKFHPFLDGNNITALYLARAFVLLNRPEILDEDFYQNMQSVIEGVDKNTINREELKQALYYILNE